MSHRLEVFAIYENLGVLPNRQEKFIIRLSVHQHNFLTNKVELTEKGTIVSVANSLDEAFKCLPTGSLKHFGELTETEFGLCLESYQFLSC